MNSISRRTPPQIGHPGRRQAAPLHNNGSLRRGGAGLPRAAMLHWGLHPFLTTKNTKGAKGIDRIRSAMSFQPTAISSSLDGKPHNPAARKVRPCATTKSFSKSGPALRHGALLHRGLRRQPARDR